VSASAAPFDVHIAGFGADTGLGFGHERLLAAVANGESAARRRFFANRFDTAMSGFGFNPEVVPLCDGDIAGASGAHYPQFKTADMAQITYKVIVDALERADIPLDALAHKRVNVFLGSPGVQPEGARFLLHIHKNDSDDIASRRGLHDLNADNHDQEALARQLADALGLKQSPLTVFSASSSGLAATWLAWCAIKSRTCDLAIVVSFQHISLFDLMFMNGFGGIASAGSGPFSTTSEGTVLGDGVCAMVLESSAHLDARRGAPYAAMDSMVMRQSAGALNRGGAFTPDFRIIDRAIAQALANTRGLDLGDIACVFPHANGVRSSDRAEALVLKKVWGETETPIVSYKGQIGYTMASSTPLDLALMCGFLDAGSLPAFTCDGEVDTGLGIHLHAKAPARALPGRVGIKIGLGVEGSVGVIIVRALRQSATPARVPAVHAHPAPPAAQSAPELGIYGLSVIEPSAQHLKTFTPVWYNAWEARMYAKACRSRARTRWPITRFGGGARDSSTTREIAFALETASHKALQEGRKAIAAGGRISKERLALLYYDSWGQASYLEPSGSWKDAFSIDVIPWKVLKALEVGAFSCKIRAGRGGFVDALRIAALLLAADTADAVLVGGLFRFHPVLGFSTVLSSAACEQRWLGRKGRDTSPVVERVGFALVGKPDAGAIRVSLAPTARLRNGFAQSVCELGQHFAKASQAASSVIGGMSPSSALADLEARAALDFNPDAAYINTAAIYGDSGGIAPLLALSHYRTLRQQRQQAPALLCMTGAHGDVHTLALE